MPVSKIRESLDAAFQAIENAKQNIKIVSWISPIGDFYIDNPENIKTIIQEGSWK